MLILTLMGRHGKIAFRDKRFTTAHIQSSAAGELEAEAKRYQSEQRMKWLDSVEAAASQQPELAKKVAGDMLHQFALKEIEDEKKAGRQMSYSTALKAVCTQRPELNVMYESGRVCEEALADVFPRGRR